MTAQEARELMPSNVGIEEKAKKVIGEIYGCIEKASEKDKYSINYSVANNLSSMVEKELLDNDFNLEITTYGSFPDSNFLISWNNQ